MYDNNSIVYKQYKYTAFYKQLFWIRSIFQKIFC